MIGSVKLSAVDRARSARSLGLLIAQAVVTSRFRALREAVLTASGVLANFGGVPLAFAFVATLGNSGVLTNAFRPRATSAGASTASRGLTVVYLYFLIPLMVLTITPALDGLRAAVAGGGRTTTARPPCSTGGMSALPVLAPSLLGGFVLLFGTAFAAYATAAAMVGSAVPLVTLQIADACPATSWSARRTWRSRSASTWCWSPALVMAVYLPLQRRSARWLALTTTSAATSRAAWRACRLPVAGALLPGPARSPRSSSPSARARAGAHLRRVHRHPRAPRASPTACCCPWGWPPRPSRWSLAAAGARAGRACGSAAPRLRPVVEVVCMLPLVVPPIALVAGISTVLRWGPDHLSRHPALPDLRRRAEPGLPGRPGARVRVLALPFVYRTLDAGLRADRRARPWSRPPATAGRAGRTRSCTCVLPNLRGALLSAAFLTLALVLGEYTVAALLGFQPFAVWIVNVSGSAGPDVGGRVRAQPARHLGCCCSRSLAGAPGAPHASRRSDLHDRSH